MCPLDEACRWALANYSQNNLRIIGTKFVNKNNRYIFQKSRIVGTVVHISVESINNIINST